MLAASLPRFAAFALAAAVAVLATGCADADEIDPPVRAGRGAALQAGRDRDLVPADVLTGVDAVLVDDVDAKVATLVATPGDVDLVVGALDDAHLAFEAPRHPACAASLHLTFLRGGAVVAGASVVCPNVPTPERVTVHFVRPSTAASASPPLDGYTEMDTMAIRRILARAAR